MSKRRKTFVGLSLLLSLGGCREPEADPITLTPEPRVVAFEAAPPPEREAPEPRHVEVEAEAEVEAEPAPPPAPAPDPEAAARAREEAARQAFEREYPWHGVAYHFLAQVHARPDRDSPVVGYMRRGAQFRAQPGLRGPGCDRGWSRVPGGGFVCRGNGFALGERPQTFEPSPVAPIADAALPYAYAWVARDDVPQYWRLPSREEEAQARAWIERQRRREAASAEQEEEPTPEPDLEAPPGLDGDATALNEEPAELTASADTDGDPAAVAPPRPAAAPVDAGVPDADEQPSFLRMRMRRGFYVSIDRLETLDGRRFYRTIRGAYVPADAVIEASPGAMRGVVLGGRWRLPLGFVHRGGVRSLSRDASDGALSLEEPVERLTPMPLTDEVITRARRRYRVDDRGRIVREDALRVAKPIARPDGIGEDARWVHVDLSEQTLVAYEGDRPVFATLVSTGRQGYETPVGTFRIQSKHVSTTMDDPNAGDEAYSIEDVPWTMYFEGSYALHAAFWHDRFGRVRSHGCVNLAPADARWIFQWSDPALPPGWHGMSAGPGRTGSFVHVTE
ncbi:MAG: L,D-transpeptidase [Myxococcota bacterium]|nr:L,D-transpeptidase [Myxococcota bacterium]